MDGEKDLGHFLTSPDLASTALAQHLISTGLPFWSGVPFSLYPEFPQTFL